MEAKPEQPLLKVLVCDDDPADRKLLRIPLQQLPDREIVMLEAGERTEIERALARGSINLVLMDIQMPGKSGMEWLAEIVEKQIAPVIMLTGSGNEELAVQTLQEGAMGYLPKASLSSEKLANAIHGALEKWAQMQQRKANQEELERLANYDSLTGLYNRAAILRKLDEEINRARRYDEEFTLSMLDIDHFKKVNDRYGHLTGDEVLKTIATLLDKDIRTTDSVGRYGGEEFIILLPETNLSSAETVAERVRRVIQAVAMNHSMELAAFGVTVSQGLSSYRPGDDRLSMISRADEALYNAKQNGRNRVETSRSPVQGK